MSDLTKKARRTKISREDVLAIRQAYIVDYDPGASKLGRHKAANVIELAQKYNLTQESIRNIANRKTFKWVS